jgi:tryptophan 2,3-dioxygenase
VSTPLTYWDYLRLDDLLGLQGGVGEEAADVSADELHFIIVHQVYELWFKLTLRELRLARDHLAADDVPEEHIPLVVHHLRRVNSILSLCVEQMRVVETLTPQDFLAFRDKLIPASGFQSFQMRELEIVMGLEDAERVRLGGHLPLEHIQRLATRSAGGHDAWGRIERARAEGSFLAALRTWLYRTPIRGSQPGQPGDDAVVAGFLDDYLRAGDAASEASMGRLAAALESQRAEVSARVAASREANRSFLAAEDVDDGERAHHRRVRAAALFIESYRHLPLLSWPRLLVDQVLEMEQQMVLFRHRHARMVERVIGRRVGTGGSSGVDYLDATGKYRVFKELWSIRTMLLAREALPELSEQGYGFARGGV